MKQVMTKEQLKPKFFGYFDKTGIDEFGEKSGGVMEYNYTSMAEDFMWYSGIAEGTYNEDDVFELAVDYIEFYEKYKDLIK